MDMTRQDGTQDGAAALLQALSGLSGAEVERRHEVLVDWAERELGVTREYAEEIYALAEEEDLEPLYALHLVGAGVGVRELEAPEQDMDEAASQQTPPEWVAEDTVELDDVTLERRLRATFRRFRAYVDDAGDPEAAARRFLEDEDVGPQRLR